MPLGTATSAVLVGTDQIVAAAVGARRRARPRRRIGMRATRGILVLAGRGPGATAGRGTLPAHHDWVEHTDELRAALSLPGLAGLDVAPFDPALHLQPIHALPLAWLSGMLDAERAALDHGIAAVRRQLARLRHRPDGDAACIGFDDGFAYVQELGRLQQRPLPGGGHGGQVIYPRTDEAWRPDAALAASVAATMTGAGGNGRGSVYESVELGAFDVLAGDDAGVERLLRHLAAGPRRRAALSAAAAAPGARSHPARRAPRAGARRADGARGMAAPAGHPDRRNGAALDAVVHRSGGPRGLRARPVPDDPVSLCHRPARRRCARRRPTCSLLPAPVPGLAALCGQAIVAEGYRGIRTRADFERAQASDPIVLSIRR